MSDTSSNVKYSALKATPKMSRSSKLTEVSKTRSERSSSKHWEKSAKKKKKRCQCELCCDKCGHPCKTGKKEKKEVAKCKALASIRRAEFCVRTEIDIAGIGPVPVLKGDPKWLPEKVQTFIAEKALLMTPAAIYICNGSRFEAEEMTTILRKQGVLETLTAYPDVHLVRTDPADTARVEKATYINHRDIGAILAGGESSKTELVNFMHSAKLETELDVRFEGCMRGRVMYVIPFSMGPVGSNTSLYAVQLTDSPYVVLNMRMMTRVCSSVWDYLGDNAPFARLIHSIGIPRPSFRVLKQNWLCSVERVLIAHRLEENEVWSFGSGYGGNSLLGKKALSLRLASWIGRKEGWLAEHAALLSITDPSGNESFITFHAPSGGGKTALALSEPTLPGWKIKILGDDISWIRRGKDGKLYAMAPECGMFGIASGLDSKKHPAAFQMLSKDALLVNAASTSKGKMYWRDCGITLKENETIRDWQGREWTPSATHPPEHPNTRFTVYTERCPNVHPLWDSPKGVPLTAMIFCSRRPDAYPLCFEAASWNEGVALAAAMRSEASPGSGRESSGDPPLCSDPMGMRPFLAYNFARYIRHWIEIGRSAAEKPKIFHVNWYRQNSDGKPLWPGYGENIRALQWILTRCVQNPRSSNVEDATCRQSAGSSEGPSKAVPSPSVNLAGPSADVSVPTPAPAPDNETNAKVSMYLQPDMQALANNLVNAGPIGSSPSAQPNANAGAFKASMTIPIVPVVPTTPLSNSPVVTSDENAIKVPCGYVPKSINSEGLDATAVGTALTYDRQFWKKECVYMKEFFAAEMGPEAPEEITKVQQKLEKELGQEG